MTDMIEVKTADLIGPALDWAVAKAEGLDFEPYFYRHGAYWVMQVVREGYNPERKVYWFSPSTDWSYGGHLVDKLLKTGQWEIVQGIGVGEVMVQNYNMECLPVNGESFDHESMCFESDSLLIAACRAFVAAKLGVVVSVPKELMP